MKNQDFEDEVDFELSEGFDDFLRDSDEEQDDEEQDEEQCIQTVLLHHSKS